MSILALLAIPLIGGIITALMTSPRRMEVVYLLSAIESFIAALWVAASDQI